MSDKQMALLGETNGVKWYWAEPGEFEAPGVYYWDGKENVLVQPAQPAASAERHPLEAYAESYEMMDRIAEEEGSPATVGVYAVAFDIRQNMIPATTTPVAAQPSVPDHLIERLRKHCDDKSNTAFARSSMREALQYLSKDT